MDNDYDTDTDSEGNDGNNGEYDGLASDVIMSIVGKRVPLHEFLGKKDSKTVGIEKIKNRDPLATRQQKTFVEQMKHYRAKSYCTRTVPVSYTHLTLPTTPYV